MFAVFIAPDWLDMNALRIWAKQLPRDALVLLTDETKDGNAVLVRQLRCESIVYATASTPGRPRSRAEFEAAFKVRDEVMAAFASRVVDFGELPGGPERFDNRVAQVIKSTV